MIIREIPPEQRKLAALKCVSWGFPRQITWAEIADGIWITDEPQTGIAWLVKWIGEGHYALHAQLAPHEGVRLPSLEVIRAIRVTAGLIGAKRVYAALGEARPGWQKLLMRSGLFEKQDAQGCYMDLECSSPAILAPPLSVPHVSAEELRYPYGDRPSVNATEVLNWAAEQGLNADKIRKGLAEMAARGHMDLEGGGDGL